MHVEEAARRASSARDGTRTRRSLPRWVRSARRRFERVPLAWRRALAAVVVLRLVLAVATFAFGGLLEGLAPVDVAPVAGPAAGPDFSGWPARSAEEQGAGLLGAGLERFDALWYLAIASDGYPAQTPAGAVPGAAAFFPLFPLIVGALGRLLLGRFALAAGITTLVATVAALAGVHRLIEEETGDADLAGRAVVALAVFPSAFFLLAPYTESLFLAVSAWALVAARRGRWGGAAVGAAAAAATRNVGVLLVLPLLLEALRQLRAGRRPGAAGWAAALLGAPAGLSAYLLFSWWRFGTPLAPVAAQMGWEREWRLPVASLVDAWRFATATPGLYPSGYHSLDVVVFAAVAAAVVWLLRRTPLPYGAYAAAHVIVWLAYPFPGRPLMSTYRFALAIAPLAWAFAAWTRSPRVATVWRSCSAGLQGVLLALFVAWYYVF